MADKKTRKPRGEERKNCNLHLRATRTQMEFLDMMCYEKEKTKTEMIWKALEFYHNYSKGSF